MNSKLQKIYDIIQQSEKLDAEQKNALLKEVKDADKELEITSFKLDRTEKVKKTTEILLEETIEELEQKRKAVEEQNHELEIEAALERVRAIALSMKAPTDMLEVCHSISDQLEFLEVKDIRNVQTAIFYEQRGTYMNYEYYTKHNKTTISETTYTNNDVHKEFATKMLKGNGEVFITHFEGDDLKEWIEYQKTTNVFIDKFLETVSSLNYYYFSLGPVALGISTYNPLKDTEIELFKRFLKVFELAYRRYLDIEKAVVQARKAQIEAALERVRSRTMAMHKSSDITQTIAHLFAQMNDLGITPYRCNIAIVDSNANSCHIWSTSNSGNVIPTVSLPLNEFSILKEMYDGWKSQKKYHVIKIAGEELILWSRYIGKYLTFDEYSPQNINKDKLIKETVYFCNAYFKQGFFVIHTKEEINEEHLSVIQRFANVFEQTYTRFLDLENAEAQNKIIQAENKRKTLELEEARKLQLAMLPKELPKLPNVEIAVYMKTATEVGGDYYDFYVNDKGILTGVIGDATGHGMKAGTIVTITKSMFNSLASENNILSIFSKISKVIREMKFKQLSMCLLMFKIEENILAISSAAMPPVLIYRKNKKTIEEFELSGMPLGAITSFPYKQMETKLHPGDTILLMSDGFPELLNDKNRMYGYDKTKTTFQSIAEKKPDAIIEQLKNSASNWAKDKDHDDDVTFVVIKIK